MKTTKLFFVAIAFPSLLFGQPAEPEPYGPLPSERQLRWHEMETYCLVHYTPTTFQNKEWGYGDADPQLFNPRRFDAGQIARAAASAGFKGLIAVAKHHDGFCLWPTATTSYSIASSPWKNGRGDMVREFMKAAHAQRMEFGVYLSAWDRNDTRYGTPAYADAYREQLRELMDGYGSLFTSWHDGANGGDGYYGGRNEKRTIDRTTYYDWYQKTWPIVRELQPMAVIFSDVGPDMRWVGNEKGHAAETSWATITPRSTDGRRPVPGSVDGSNLGTGDRDGQYWIPAECDVPHRPGWFYHPEQDERVKTPDQLFDIYLKSVGRGANMNLGLAPMPDGYLHDNDVKSLEHFGRKIRETFRRNLASRATITASNTRGNVDRFSANNLLDDDRYSYYAPDDGVLSPSLEIALPGEREFDIIRLRENIMLGQRLDSVLVEIPRGNGWQPLARATSIGANRLIKLEKPVKASRLKVTLYAPVTPTLSDFGLFREFKEDFKFDKSAPAKTKLSDSDYRLITKELDRATDGNPATFATLAQGDKSIVIELKNGVSAIGYLPRQDGQTGGTATKFTLLTSDDGKDWKPFRQGEFSNIRANPIEQVVYFGEPMKANYVKFVPTETIGRSFTVAELTLYH